MMIQPRSFGYGSVSSTPASTTREFDEKTSRRKNSYYNTITIARNPQPSKPLHSHATLPVNVTPARRPDTHMRAVTEPVAIPSRSLDSTAMFSSSKARTIHTRKTSTVKHNADALSPSVVALLAMTAIPPMRPHQTRRRRTTGSQRMSIDELVAYWKSDESLKSSISSSPSMSVLLEDVYDTENDEASGKASMDDSSFCRTRSTSTDSVPSLDGDEQSLVSLQSPSTPASLRSRRSITNLRREKFKSASVGQECLLDHPLLPPPAVEPETEFVDTFAHARRDSTIKQRSSFRSNLTTSLQALKNAARTLTFKTAPASREVAGLRGGSRLSDDVLWSHPFLFPRLSPEIRPSIQGTPTQAQRRYLNPMPLTFEEQEAPFQQALHAPFLAEAQDAAPLIQLQTYTRGRRKVSRTRSKTPDPQSEAGRALQLAAGMRQREPRENSDFLRVVVMEMNMRRAGKLESGRAKIWLPPRQVSERCEEQKSGTVPARWVGICA